MDSILIIDDEPQIRKLLSRMMELEGYEVFQAADCQSTLKQLKLHNPQVVLCDVFLPDGNGVDMVTTIKKLYPELEVILLTAHGNIPDGVQAIKNGAFDYITKGDDNNKIIPLISRAMAQAKKNVGEKVKTEETQSFSFDAIKGKSEGMQQAVALARKVSATDVTVLLTGETGTGKEVFAQAIHRNSLRKENAFVAVNCSAFSKDLLESEIFGHKAGSFTGAMKDKKGLFEVADNGTIFLDEIGEMAFELQAKLLRVLEAGEYIKIGDTKPTKVNVRVISATNRDLKKEIEQGNFREDLYYRLSVFQIHLPPLRERKEDIELLAESFIQLFSKKLGKQVEGMAPEFLKALKAADWRGNIRELRNVIERSMIVCDKQLTLQDLRTIKIRKMRITKKRSPRLILQSLVKNGYPYIIICIWCVLSGGCVQNKSQDSLKTLKTEIRHIIKDKKATIGVALILDGEDTLAINNAEKYPMMSVYKFHQALAVCDYLQKRHIPLSTSLYLDKKYFKPDTYSPLRDKYPQGNLELPISELLVYTMQSSDNVACDILFDYIGGVNVVDEYIHSLGINDVSITATEDEMHQGMDDCYKNWTTPMEAANLLELFMTQDFMRNEYTDFLKHIMIECGTGKDRLPAPLPESEVKIGHKTGTSDKNDRGEYIGINDIGFVILPDGSRYVVAVFVKDSKENMETNAKIISDISAAVYRYAGNR